jgi:hypothetical protein
LHTPGSAVLAATHRSAASKSALVQQCSLAGRSREVDVAAHTKAARCCAVTGVLHGRQDIQAAARGTDIGAKARRSASSRCATRRGAGYTAKAYRYGNRLAGNQASDALAGIAAPSSSAAGVGQGRSVASRSTSPHLNLHLADACWNRERAVACVGANAGSEAGA